MDAIEELLNMSNREDLQKQANEKLSQAWKLIDEAGELAKEGQFSLHFGEVGDFIPRSAVDRKLLRKQAMENLKREGRDNGSDRLVDEQLTAERGYTMYKYVDRPKTPWDDLTEDQRETAIEEEIDGLIECMEVPWEFREYCGADDADTWWHPSRC